MAAIPTILKGDDSGAISITMASGRTYTGATLVVAYQGVTRSFTNLTPGQTISLTFTHQETSGFALKTAPLLMRLIGQYGAEETVENAEARIRVTDCLAEVNAGGSFVVQPGGSVTDPTKVPITDVGDMAARYSLADLKAKVDQIVRVLAQRSLLGISILAAFCASADVTVHTARLDTLYNDAMVVTNVTGGGASGGVDTNAVNDLIGSYDATNLTQRIDVKTDAETVTNIVDGIVSSSNLCTVAAASDMTNGLMRASDYHGDYITDGINTINANREVFEYLRYVITNGVTVLLYKHEPPSFGKIAEYRSEDYDGVTKGVVYYNDDFGGGICSPVLTPGYWPPSGMCYTCFPGETHTLHDITVTISADMYAEPPYRTIGKLATTNDIPTALKNPKALRFAGAESGEYDGSAEMTVNIPSTAAIESSVASVSNRQDTLEGYIAGQRVRVSVTNYYGNTSGQLPRLRIEEFITATNVTDGVSTETNYWQMVWDEQDKYDQFKSEATSAISAMTNNLYQTYYALLMERLNTKAPRAWGTLTSAGEAAPAGSVWHTEPNTVFAGGTEYAHAMVGTGVIGVLTTKGAAVYTDGETGRFHFTTDDKTSYFGMNIATRYELGCATDGITVTDVGGNKMVDLLYNVTMTGKPILYYTPTLSGNITWEQITDSSGGAISGATVYASWDAAPPAGSEICTINCGAGVSGFFKASVEYAGTCKFETNMMADLQGGVLATNQTSNQMQPVEPYISNGSVLWRIKQ